MKCIADVQVLALTDVVDDYVRVGEDTILEVV